MKKLVILLSVLFAVATVKAQGYNTYDSLSTAINLRMSVGVKFSVFQNGIVSDFVVMQRSDGYIKPDSIMVIAMKDSIHIAVRQSNYIKPEYFKRPGESDWYNALTRLANYASAVNGARVWYNPGFTYKIDTMKTGTPKFKTNITERDSFYIDTSGQVNDTIIIKIIDTTTTLTNSYIPNNITDILWIDPQNLTVYGNGATIDIKGDFDRKWTHSASNGAVHQSAYNTVCPFAVVFGKNVTIDGININGNDDKTTESTPVNEGQAYGMWFRGTDVLTVTNCKVHHIQTDGLYIEGTGAGTPGPRGGKIFHTSTYANVSNCKFDFCGRQGLTIGGLYIGKFINCGFNGTADTSGLGTQPFAFRGHAPQKGLDIEPIYEYSHSTLIRADNPTTNITFDNCTFLDNVGGSIAMSHPYTVNGIIFKNCTMDNSKYNRLYNVISTVPGVTFDNCNINTGTGAMYVTRDQGGEQRIIIKHNVITSGGSGFITGAAAQYGAIIEDNWIIGKHDTAYKGYFPTVSSDAIFINNHVVLDSGLYYGTNQRRSGQIYTAIAEGNSFISPIDTLTGLMYAIQYIYPRTVAKEHYIPKQAVRPYGGWDVLHSDYTAGKVGLGAIQVVNGGFGKPEIKQYWLAAVPTVNPPGDTYKEGDVIWMTKPGTAGYNLYRCVTGGDFTATPPVFSPVGAVSLTGAAVYHNGMIVTGSDYYLGRFVDSGGTSKYSHSLLPDGGVYFSKLTSDTGLVVFKSPLSFLNTGDLIVKGSLYMRGKGNADFIVSSLLLGNATFNNSNAIIRGDSSLLSTKIRWMKDVNGDVYLGFFDTTVILSKQTIVHLESVTLTASTQSYPAHSSAAWTPFVLKSLSGYTATVVANTAGANYNTLINKPSFATVATSGLYTDLLSKPTIPAQVNPTAGTGMTITGTYPNLTFNSTATGGVTVIGTGTTYSRQIAAALGSGTITENFPVDRLTTSSTLTSQQLKLHAIWLPNDTLLTGVRYFLGTSGVFTANNFNGLGLYSYNGTTGVATLVATTANDATTWTTTAGWNSKAFTSTYTATKGVYFVATLYSASAATTVPTLATCTNSIGATVFSADFTNGAKLVSILSAQTALPSTITMSATATTLIQPYLALY